MNSAVKEWHAGRSERMLPAASRLVPSQALLLTRSACKTTRVAMPLATAAQRRCVLLPEEGPDLPGASVVLELLPPAASGSVEQARSDLVPLAAVVGLSGSGDSPARRQQP